MNSFADVQCSRAPDALHFFQLSRVELTDGRVLTVDRCRHCGALSDDPGASVVEAFD